MNPGLEKLPLRDIHLPDPVGWWPPAPGWWGILALLVTLLLLSILIRRLIRRGRLKRSVLDTLNKLTEGYRKSEDGPELARELSVLLRRTSLTLYPRQQVASLTGEEWLAFLDRAVAASKADSGFSQGPGRCLLQAPYNPRMEWDAEALIELVRIWIGKATAGARGREWTK